jgi:hypothetical protein
MSGNMTSSNTNRNRVALNATPAVLCPFSRVPIHILLVLSVTIASAGCQATALGNRTIRHAGSVTDVYYSQVLENLALTMADPSALPYFTDPATQSTTLQRTGQANYQLGWDLVLSPAQLLGRYLFDKQSSQIQGSQSTSLQWQGKTTDNPDKLLLMQEAYRTVLGQNNGNAKWLPMYYAVPSHQGSKLRYSSAIHPGWVCFGTKKDCPKGTRYIGHSGSVYVWVPNDRTEELSQFTLAILDIATASTMGGGAGQGSSSAAVEARPAPFFTPRENFFNPFVIQGPLPIP